MKRTSSRIKEDIARLQEQLRQAETREAERIGRIALKAGIGEVDIEEDQLLAALGELAQRFRNRPHKVSPADNNSAKDSQFKTATPHAPG